MSSASSSQEEDAAAAYDRLLGQLSVQAVPGGIQKPGGLKPRKKQPKDHVENPAAAAVVNGQQRHGENPHKV